MRIPTPLSDAAAKEASRRELWKPGPYDGCFSQAIDRLSQNHNEMIDAVVTARHPNGQTREFREYLNAASPISSAKLREAAEAVGALYEAGEISAADFLNREVKVRIGVQKRRGFQPRNIIEMYQSASASSIVHQLRSAG
jgi:hypothetical protein